MAEIEPTQAHIERAIEMMRQQFGTTLLTSHHAIQALASLLVELDAAKAAHDADRGAFSEVAKDAGSRLKWIEGQNWAIHSLVGQTSEIRLKLASFILPDPEPVDPLVEALRLIAESAHDDLEGVRRKLAKHNLEIREINNG